MRLYEFIMESRSADLYHGTTLPNAESIVTSDTFVAKTPIHSDFLPKEVKGSSKTVSFTRDNKVLHKFISGNNYSDIGAILVIDQGLLSRDMGKRLQAYSDLETKWYKDQLKRWSRHYEPQTTTSRSRGTSESEELVFGDITNANKYIKKILVDMSGPQEYDNYRAEQFAKSPLSKDPRTVVIMGGTYLNGKEFIKMYNQSSKLDESLSVGDLPSEPGTEPILPGNVRLYHQTSEDNLKAIEQTGLRIEHAKGIEGPRAVYASETGFYGEPGTRPTLEFQMPKKYWDDPFVLRDVEPADIIAAHYPWHSKARYIEEHPKVLKEVLEGKHDDLQGDYKLAVEYIKNRYSK